MPDTIDKLEYWVAGKKVDKVYEGDSLEVRVHYTIASAGGFYRIKLQRKGGAILSSPLWEREPKSYYLPFYWTVNYPAGTYSIYVEIWNSSRIGGEEVLVDSKTFTHEVLSKEEKPEEEKEWWEKLVEQIPGGWYTIAAIGGFAGIIGIVSMIAYEEEKRMREMMIMLMR